MIDIKGRMLLVDWGEFGIIGLIKFPKGLGNRPEEFGLTPKTNKKNVKLFDLRDSGVPTMPIVQPVEGDVLAEFTRGREISEYLINDSFWLTDKELKEIEMGSYIHD